MGEHNNSRFDVGMDVRTEVLGADLNNGLLSIELARPEPGRLIRTINITDHEGPYAFHTGGVNTLRADGSVLFLKSSTAANVLAAFITKSGVETLSPD